MKNYHVAMVIARYPPTIGGTELQCRELSKALVKRGHRVSVLTEQNERTLPQRAHEEGIDIYRFAVGHTPLISSFRYAQYLSSWLRENPDVNLIHAHMLAGPAMAAFVMGQRARKPVVLKIAGAGITGDIGTSRQRWRGAVKLALFKRWARLIACPSRRTFEEIRSLGIPERQLRLIPNGVRTDRFKPVPQVEKAAMRSKLGIGERKRVALYTGRWAEGKGLDLLLSVWENGAHEDFPWHLLLVVSQPPPESAQQRLRALGKSVSLVVGPPEITPYYQAADLAVLLSENEGLSNFLLEAMASSLPLLTTRGGAIASLEESQAWSWIAPADASEIRALLTSIGKQLAVMSAKGEAARVKALTTFSVEGVAAAYERLYTEALTVNH